MAHLGLEPLVLAESTESADGNVFGRLQGLRDADYAIVLLSTDDIDPASVDPDPAGVRRAILLEIGFLIGAVGRERVCLVLAGEPVAAPDLAGVPSQPMDNGGVWRLLLAREMRQAGLDVDMNRAL